MRKTWLASVVAVAMAHAGGAVANDYLTAGVDNARTGFIKDEKILTKANAGQVKLLWSQKLPSQPRQMHNLFSPLVAESISTPSGAKEVAIVAGVSDDVWGLDAKSGAVLWHVLWPYTTGERPAPSNALGNVLCPAGQTAMPTMERMANGTYRVWAVSWDGMIHQIDAATGRDLAPAEKFVPGGGKPYALNLYNGVVYTATAQGCGGVTNGMYAYDSRTRKASVFYPAGGGLWGRRGTSIDSDGRAYMGTGDARYNPATNSLGNAVVAAKLDNNSQLQVTGWFAPINANWAQKHDLDINVTPMVVDYKGRKFVIHSAKECALYVADRDNLGGADHRRTVADPVRPCNDRLLWDEHGVWGSISAYQDAAGKEWIYVPFWGARSAAFNPPIINSPRIPTTTDQMSDTGGVAALTLDQVGSTWKLTPRWLSQNMDMAEEGLIANGVYWVYGSGEDTRQQGREIAWNDTTMTWGNRVQLSRHATLFALDAATGKTLWSSGNQITSWNHFSGISLANGKVYLATYDGTVWCFGIAGS